MPPKGETRAQKGRATACDPQEFERYRGPLRAYAYARVGDWQAAEDLAQETVVRALQSPRTPRDPDEIPHYLRRILKNLCINFARDSRPTASLRLCILLLLPACQRQPVQVLLDELACNLPGLFRGICTELRPCLPEHCVDAGPADTALLRYGCPVQSLGVEVQAGLVDWRETINARVGTITASTPANVPDDFRESS